LEIGRAEKLNRWSSR